MAFAVLCVSRSGSNVCAVAIGILFGLACGVSLKDRIFLGVSVDLGDVGATGRGLGGAVGVQTGPHGHSWHLSTFFLINANAIFIASSVAAPISNNTVVFFSCTVAYRS